MGCCGGLNQISVLGLPDLDRSDGVALDVSGLVGNKSFQISGTYSGSYTILGSEDGLSYVPLLTFNSGAGAQAFKQTTELVVKFVKVRRRATNLSPITISVSGTSSLAESPNNFIALATITANQGIGPLPSVDLWALVAPTGLDAGFAVTCVGDFEGIIALEGSLDGIQFSPIGDDEAGKVGGFVVASKIPGSATPELSPLRVGEVVRFLRPNILPNTRINGPINIAIGGSKNAMTAAGTIAEWPTSFVFGATPRYFAVDSVNGDDVKNQGFSDVSQKAAGLVAVKTLSRLMQILPRFGQGRACRVAVAAGNYASDTQWTIDDLRGFANSQTANSMLFIGTGTVPSAGSVKFAGDLNDSLCAGFVNATGMNAAGYNVTAYAVDSDGTPRITLQLNGGGSPGFTADSVARPYGCRIRFDVATTTANLQNTMSGIIRTTGAGQLVLSVALSTPPVIGDVLYIEMPGVSGPLETLVTGSGDGVASIQFCGIAFGTLNCSNSIVTVCGCEAGNVVCTSTDMNCQDSGVLDSAAALGNFTRGCSLRSNFYAQSFGNFRGVGCATTSSTSVGMSWIGCESVNWERSASFSGVQKTGVGGGGNSVTQTIGTNGSTVHGATCQIFGAVASSPSSGFAACGVFVGSTDNLGRILCENMGANPCLRVAGAGLGVNFAGTVSGTTGNTDVGLDLTSFVGRSFGGAGCTIALGSPPTITGTVGDVRLSDGTIVTWAAAQAGIVDVNGNMLYGAARFPIPVQPSTAGLAVSFRLQEKRGASVASAGTITLGNDGNYFHVTGAIPIDFVTKTNWQDGGGPIEIYIQDGTTLNHNTAAPPGTALAMKLLGGVNAIMAAGSKIRFRRDDQQSLLVEMERGGA